MDAASSVSCLHLLCVINCVRPPSSVCFISCVVRMWAACSLCLHFCFVCLLLSSLIAPHSETSSCPSTSYLKDFCFKCHWMFQWMFTAAGNSNWNQSVMNWWAQDEQSVLVSECPACVIIERSSSVAAPCTSSSSCCAHGSACKLLHWAQLCCYAALYSVCSSTFLCVSLKTAAVFSLWVQQLVGGSLLSPRGSNQRYHCTIHCVWMCVWWLSEPWFLRYLEVESRQHIISCEVHW